MADSPEDKGDLGSEVADRWDPGRLSRTFLGSEAGSMSALDHTTRNRYERILGRDFGDVRVMRGALAEEVTRARHAEALTVGGTGLVLMGSGRASDPGSSETSALLGHELGHVASGSPGGVYALETPPATSQAGTDEDEEVARMAAAEVLGDEAAPGGGPRTTALSGKASGEARAKKEQMRQQVIERVIERLDSAACVIADRRGLNLRFRLE
jgi:hypothetical protein